MGRLKGKVVLITGAAMGIGEADAKLCAEEGGAKVVVADVNESEGKRVAGGEIRQRREDAIFVKLDVSKEEDWKKAIRETLNAYGKLNVLINNAGVSLGKILKKLPWKIGTG